eukprot:tig00021433_g21270.t1
MVSFLAALQQNELVGKLKRFDAYPKTHDDYRQKTALGGAVSLISGIIIFYLFMSEFVFYLSQERKHELYVDTSRGEKLAINMDITFTGMACSVLSLDAMDISGEHQLDVFVNVFKTRIDSRGEPIDEAKEEKELGEHEAIPDAALKNETDPNYCGSCYGAEEPKEGEPPCCNTCDQVREAYRRRGWAFSGAENIEQCVREGFVNKLKNTAGEGCRVHGSLEVNKVAGNFHFAPGKSFQQAHMHVHDLMPFQSRDFNVSHIVHKLSFGKEFPGIVNPLDGQKRIVSATSGMFQYFIKVVPTKYQKADGKVISTNQFAFTEHFRNIDAHGATRSLPGVFFFYDLSPLMVQVSDSYRSFSQFLTSVCAIVGGVFTVAGIIDSFLFYGQRTIVKKMRLGKMS